MGRYGMDFKRFSELREFIRRYNSTSVLEVGTKKCWQHWEVSYSKPLDWLLANTDRNYAVRIMLLASAGNPHRHQNINIHEFERLVKSYHNWDGHTISDTHILEEEARVLTDLIREWEANSEKVVRNWSSKLSEILNSSIIRPHMTNLFLQRSVAFQNSGFGYPIARIRRTIKLIELLINQSDQEFSKAFSSYIGLDATIYFRQFLSCLGLFGYLSERRGFCNFSRLPNIEPQLQEAGITVESIKAFAQQNSTLFFSRSDNSLRSNINQTLNKVPEYYQPFFYNHFLEIPFIELNDKEFCLPDPFSFTESCWNQVRSLILKKITEKKLGQCLSRAFENYLENVFLPLICPSSFHKIPEVTNPTSSKDKRADFLVETQKTYILIECKNCVMDSDTSAYFQVDKLADLWCRIHSALEQIKSTVEAFNLRDKPVIPLILTFYDSIAAATIFKEMIEQTNYCSLMNLNVPPIVYSLHEFEHWISDRSLDNWSELILKKKNDNSSIMPDNRGHNYAHLKDISIL